MTKIVIIGAGSQFGGKLSRDILAHPPLQNATIGLCDIDPEKLENTARYVRRIMDGHGLPATLETSVHREELLGGADFVVLSISVGGAAYSGFPVTEEVNLPNQYGLSQSVADTIGIGGVFRFLRTAPEQLAVCRDMERLCPNALLLNYTNPMCMLTWLHSVGSTIQNVGLCHSVQHTANQLAGYLDVPRNEITYQVAGINHQAWFLSLRHHGDDLYPRLRDCLDDPEIVAKDNIRFEMMRHFGYFVTESSRHCSEYHPYFRRTKELMSRYDLKEWTVDDEPRPARIWLEGDELPPLDPSEEYAAEIIRAVATDRPYRFWGNVLNTGLIDNLPQNCCVEVCCLVDGEGLHPCHAGGLPPQLAHLNLSNIAVQELAVEAFLQRDRELAFQACALDPLTRATLSLDDMRRLFDRIWSAEKELLTHFDAE